MPLIFSACQLDVHIESRFAQTFLSAWIAEQGLHCTLNIGFFEAAGHAEAKAWGILLADLVRHIGNAVTENRGTPASETVAAVIASMHAEIDLPSSGAVGEFHVGHA